VWPHEGGLRGFARGAGCAPTRLDFGEGGEAVLVDVHVVGDGGAAGGGGCHFGRGLGGGSWIG